MKALILCFALLPLAGMAQKNETHVTKYLTLSGEWCAGNLILQANFGNNEGTWQWTRNGIVLEETGSSVNLTKYGPGKYTVMHEELVGVSSDKQLAASSLISDSYEFETADGPTAAFEAKPNYPIACIQFSNNSLLASGEHATADHLTYSWDLGDGTTSSEFTPVHPYMTEGIFHVTLTVTDTKGCSNSVSADIPFFYPD